MCSVPGVPTPGSEVSVVITRVNLNQNCGLVELWVNLNNEIKHVYDQMREDIQTPNRKFYGPEGKTGDLCLANIDEKWHRARIVSMQEENYNVFLIDHGQPHSTLSDKLAWGKHECFILPPEIECCIIANILSIENNWPERATNFLKSLPGKEFRGLVQHALMPDRTILLDLPIISKHLCKEGVAKKIPSGEFKNLVLKCLNLPKENAVEMITEKQNLTVSNQLGNDNQYFYPELMTNTLESIRVTEVIDPGNIFCELTIYSKAVKNLSEQMDKELKASLDESQPQTIGMPCAALGIAGKWQRAVLKQQITSRVATVEVFFVDEGKTELVQATNVKKLDWKFLRMPVATYNCKMEGVKNNKQWEQKEIDYLKSLILNQNIIARFDCHILPEDQYSVSLYTPSASCINDYFLEKKVEEIKSDTRPNIPCKQFLSSTTRDVTSPSYLPTSYNSSFSPMEMPLCDFLAAGASVGVRISCIDSLDKFWCQLSRCDKKLDILMKDLQAHYASVHPKPLVESVCVTRNPDDNMWYRAKIITNQQSPDVEVRLIDFGQTRKVPLRELRPIDPTFLRLDAQAFQCSLINVPPTDINYANEEFRKFVNSSLAQDGGLNCVIKAVVSDEEGMLLNLVDLQTQSESASQIIAEKLAARHVEFNHSDHKIDVNSKEKITISYSETVHNFYCQLDRDSQLFHQVQSDIERLVANSVYSEYSFAVNDLCIARYSDSKWQRGQVVEISPNLKVHFVDFGETLTVNRSEIQPFTCEASATRTTPVLAVALQLFNIPEEIPQEVDAWFAKKVVGQSLTMSVLGKGPNGKLMVELFDGLKSLNAQVREKIMNFAKADATDKQEETMDVPNGDGTKQNGRQKSPIMQSEQFNIINKPTSPSQNLLSNFTAEKMDANIELTSDMQTANQEKTKSTHDEIATLDKSLTYKKPVISFNKTEVLYASSISRPDYFWCQYSNADDLDKVTRIAQIEGQAPQDPFFAHLQLVGTPCLALYKSDNQWYRAQVVEKKRDAFLVVFIDYGNEEDIDYKDVRPISPSLLEMAPQAFLCTLYGIHGTEELWDDALYDDFYILLKDKPLNVTVLDMGQNLDVKMPQYMVHIDDADLHNLLKKHGIVPKSTSKKIYEPSQDYLTHFYSEPNSLVNKKVEAIVTSSSGPARFWCQYSDSEKLIELIKLIPKGGLEEELLFSDALSPGSPCLSLSSDGNQWNRAQVIERQPGRVKVALVDYGYEEELCIKDTRPIPPSLRIIQPQAFLCHMEHFDKNAVWDDKLNHLFHKAMADKVFELTIVSVEFNEDVKIPQYSIELDASSLEKLKKKFYKQSGEEVGNMPQSPTQIPVLRNTLRTPELEKNTTVSAYALSISGPGYFWCQFCDRIQLDEIKKMAKDEATMPRRDWNFGNRLIPGDTCIALFTDCCWYRAQILSKTEDKFSVLFIDYGNEGDVMIANVRPISQSLLKIPPRAFLCSLGGFEYSRGDWDDASYNYLDNFLTDKLLKVTPIRKCINQNNKLPQFVVDIQCGTKSVKEVMQKYWKANSNVDNVLTEPAKNEQAKSNLTKKMTYKNPSVTLNKTELVYATCIDDPHFFWCQFATWADQPIEKMAQEAGLSQPVPTTLNKGDSCLSLFSDDNQWCRALVNEKNDEKFNVVFVDYGNETDDVMIKDTRILPQNLLDEPPQAFLCMLYGFDQSQGTWDDKVYDSFYNTILDKLLKVKIMTVTENSDIAIPQYAVQIEMEGGTDVNKLMEKYWIKSAYQTPKVSGAGSCQDFQLLVT
ncbi:tudor domain-containing 6 [Periophthalmus magnuspinnatus]|uniref:tudor domain-containing 6 n=1 Tax=Periophthalmus magnuspinnatus TaxID=409849 RepID=UPI002436B92C|nr:tudor domain-containing 6 [Periophthalmus magnuspinnatus]